jgi:hypothetical protein
VRIGAIALAACATSAAPVANVAPPGSHEVIATIARGGCYGTCPIYKLTVYRDGTVEYTGDNFVKVKGPARGRVGPEVIAAIDRLFHDAHYFELADAYTERDRTDNPTTITEYRDGGRTKTITHYRGDDHTPEILTNVEDALDALVHVEQFIGTETERDALDTGD